mmetsp:Transcript_6271/g.26658  ORF Transcript_6271/g.26658 Transcript_6271/m.26658 type:complete len:315 (+) Transcript_6271:943-1887(+)
MSYNTTAARLSSFGGAERRREPSHDAPPVQGGAVLVGVHQQRSFPRIRVASGLHDVLFPPRPEVVLQVWVLVDHRVKVHAAARRRRRRNLLRPAPQVGVGEVLVRVQIRPDQRVELPGPLQFRDPLRLPPLLRGRLHLAQTDAQLIFHAVRARLLPRRVVRHVPQPLVLRQVILVRVSPRDHREQVAPPAVRRGHVHALRSLRAAHGRAVAHVAQPVILRAVLGVLRASVGLQHCEQIAAAVVQTAPLVARRPVEVLLAPPVRVVRPVPEPLVGVVPVRGVQAHRARARGAHLLHGVEQMFAPGSVVHAHGGGA